MPGSTYFLPKQSASPMVDTMVFPPGKATTFPRAYATSFITRSFCQDPHQLHFSGHNQVSIPCSLPRGWQLIQFVSAPKDSLLSLTKIEHYISIYTGSSSFFFCPIVTRFSQHKRDLGFEPSPFFGTPSSLTSETAFTNLLGIRLVHSHLGCIGLARRPTFQFVWFIPPLRPNWPQSFRSEVLGLSCRHGAQVTRHTIGLHYLPFLVIVGFRDQAFFQISQLFILNPSQGFSLLISANRCQPWQPGSCKEPQLEALRCRKTAKGPQCRIIAVSPSCSVWEVVIQFSLKCFDICFVYICRKHFSYS